MFALLILGCLTWLSSATLTLGQVWSPDGLWLAYTTPRDVPPSLRRQALEDLFRSEPQPELVPKEPWSSNRSGGSRLWCTREDSLESVLIEEQADGWLTEPAWGHKGQALVYGRIARTDASGPLRIELIIRDSLDHSRVLNSWPWEPASEAVESRATQGVSWSPDDALISVPYAGREGQGLILVQASDGRLLARLPGAFAPAWNQDGQSLAYFYANADTGKDQAGLGLWKAGTEGGSSRNIDLTRPLIPKPSARPGWIEDGRFLLYPSVKGQDPANHVDQLLIGFIPLDARSSSPAQDLAIPANVSPAAIHSFEIAVDPQGEGIFTSHAIGSQSTFTWFRGGNGAVYKRFSPFDLKSPLIAISMSPRPGRRRIACRIEGPDGISPPAICDPGTESFEPLAPDAASTYAWQKCIDHGILSLALETGEPVADPRLVIAQRPSCLPIPGELSPGHPGLMRLRRLGTEALDLQKALDRRGLVSSAPGERPNSLFLAAMVSGDYTLALTELQSLEEAAPEVTTRLRLQGLRAQVYLAMGEVARAAAVTHFLQGQAERRGIELAELEGRFVLGTNSASAEFGWISNLSDRIDDIRTGRNRHASEPISPLGLGLPSTEPPAGTRERLMPAPDFMPPGPPQPGLPVDPQKRRPILIEPDDE